MPFAIDSNASPSEISDAINYLLSNFGPNLAADPDNGQISGPGGDIIGYLYKYIAVKYADSFDGSLNFSDSPTNRLYYGIRNSNDSVESTNHADYVWYKVAGGFGTTKFLFYIVTGGRSIQFQVDTSTPNPGWVMDTGVSIDLDFTTSAKAVANFVVIRIPNNSGAPTDAECLAAIGRTPISGDLCTVNYNNGIYSITYKYTTGWAIFQKYITGDLIVANSIVASNIDTRNLTIKDSSGNIIFGSGASVTASPYIVPPSGWLNSNVSINANGTLSGAGSGQVNLGGLGAGNFAYLNQITSANVTTYISGAAIGTAQIGVLTAGNIGAGTIDASKIAAGTIWTNFLQVGSTPAVSGTSMSGAGAVINNTGTFALGNSSTNISFNGSQMTLNGNVVATGNINLNAVTSSSFAASNGFQRFASGTITTTVDDTFATSYIYANSGDQILIDCTFYYRIENEANQPWILTPQIFCNGSLIFTGYAIPWAQIQTSQNFSQSIKALYTAPSTGTQTINLNTNTQIVNVTGTQAFGMRNLLVNAFIGRR
jgi:hypothetical protein